MTDQSPAPPVFHWRRIAAEGSAIVVSILLAFAIQAWWEGRTLAQALDVQLRSTLGEIEDARTELDFNNMLRIRTSSNVAALALLLDSVPTGSRVTVGDTVVTSLASYLVTEFPTAQLDALLNGEFPAFDRSPLRGELMSLRTMMDDQRDDEIVLRDFVTEELGPYLRAGFDVAAAQRAWTPWLLERQVTAGRTELAATRELRNLISWKQRSVTVLLGQATRLGEALDRAAAEVRLALAEPP